PRRQPRLGQVQSAWGQAPHLSRLERRRFRRGISALNTISYYESVLKHMGPNQDNWLRLFMIPGMAHCGGGTGPDQFNAPPALERGRKKTDPPKPTPPLEPTNVAAPTCLARFADPRNELSKKEPEVPTTLQTSPESQRAIAPRLWN